MKAMKLGAFLGAACLATAAVIADDQRGTIPDSSASAGATGEKDRTGGSEDLPKEFRGLDLDKDGFLSKAELSSKRELAAAFEKADKDGNGKLDPAEYQVLAEVSIKG
jgi:ABC-type glycerol-3-phosphate transport system substrate-binding protein